MNQSIFSFVHIKHDGDVRVWMTILVLYKVTNCGIGSYFNPLLPIPYEQLPIYHVRNLG
jgi:hypothetical protein